VAGLLVLLCGVALFGRYFEPRVFGGDAWRRVFLGPLTEAAGYLAALIVGIAWWLWGT